MICRIIVAAVQNSAIHILPCLLYTSSVKASLVNAETGKCVSSAFFPKTEAKIIAVNPVWAEQDPDVYKIQALAQLPYSCVASADCLEQQRAIFEQYNVFSSAMIDGIIRKLRNYEDRCV